MLTFIRKTYRWPFLTVIIYIIVTWQLRLDLKGVKITGKIPGMFVLVREKIFFLKIFFLRFFLGFKITCELPGMFLDVCEKNSCM